MPLPEYFEFQDRTKLIYAAGGIDQAGSEAKNLGGTKVFIITDPVMAKMGLADRVKKSVEAAGLAIAGIFDQVPVDSDVEVVEKCYAIAKEAGTDLTIAIGGGSSMDTAKAVNILLTEGGNLLDDHQGAYLLERPLKPMIAIPTTAGTGSEVTFAAVIKDRAQGIKLSFISPFMAPNAAILDPEVTLTMPPSLTAATGMDALSHCIEAMHSTSRVPITDALAYGGIRMIAKNLRDAVSNGSDVDVRGNMLVASTIAGLAFTNALVGIVHGTAHSIGGAAHVPHGVAISIMLPWCMEWNLDFAADVYAEVAAAFGVPRTGDDRADAIKGIEEVRKLTRDINMPQTLGAAGVTEAHLEEIAGATMGDGSIFTNPRPVEDEAEVLALLKQAF